MMKNSRILLATVLSAVSQLRGARLSPQPITGNSFISVNSNLFHSGKTEKAELVDVRSTQVSALQIFGSQHMQPEKCFLHGESLRGGSGSPLGHKSSLLSTDQGAHEAPLNTIQDLIDQYDTIFTHGNRNAASHLWAQYVLSRSHMLTHEKIQELFNGFCPVSGSPLGPPSPNSRYLSTLTTATGGSATGFTNHCCWPCICDTTDLLKIDTLSVIDKEGTSKQYNFTVIGNPCVNNPSRCTKASEEREENCIPIEAPDVNCEDGKLERAVLSDNGHVIVGMYYPESIASAGEYIDYETEADQEGNTLKGMCEERQNAGFHSGMGAIFQMVARLNKI